MTVKDLITRRAKRRYFDSLKTPMTTQAGTVAEQNTSGGQTTELVEVLEYDPDSDKIQVRGKQGIVRATPITNGAIPKGNKALLSQGLLDGGMF